MKRLVVLISNVGSGSNLLAIINATKSSKIDMEICAVVSDLQGAKGLEHAKKNNLKIKICSSKEDLLNILNELNPDFIALAGWKQIISNDVLSSYPNRILNIHPGLIPESLDSQVWAPDKSNALWNRGLLANKAIQNFLDKKSTYAGSSIHFLTHEFDFGPVLERTFEKIKKEDTVETLYARLKKKEHQIYIKALKKLSHTKKLLIVDGGGRASILAQKYSTSKNVSQLFAVPGNDYLKYCQNVTTFPNIKTSDVQQIVKIAKKEGIDLVDVAQDDAVAAGLVDSLKKAEIEVFGPTRKAGQIEWDKAWSRNFMKKFYLPHPLYKVCKSEKEGKAFLSKQKNRPWFIKASGLAAGKGAIYAKDNNAALKAIKKMPGFGNAGKIYLIEEVSEGEEFSAFAAVCGGKFEIIGYAQDHKRAFDGDKGPNTGGMGCSSPPRVITENVKKQIESIFKKTTTGLVSINRPYVGILYLGGIVNKTGKVTIIEFNARWGDPEAQVILPSIKNDYFEFISNILKARIPKVIKDDKYRVIVAATSKGYPKDYSKVSGKKIEGFKNVALKVKIYGAGIKKEKEEWIAAGGRLFYVLGEGKNVAQARKMAYNALSLVSIEKGNLHYRKDIGFRDMARNHYAGRKTKTLSV